MSRFFVNIGRSLPHEYGFRKLRNRAESFLIFGGGGDLAAPFSIYRINHYLE